MDDKSGRTVAYARWQLPHTQQNNKKNSHDDELNDSSLLECTNVRLMKAFGKAMDETKQSLGT